MVFRESAGTGCISRNFTPIEKTTSKIHPCPDDLKAEKEMISMVPDTPDYLSGTTSFERKYPQIADISISITETRSGIRREYLQAGYRDIKKVPGIHPCSNPKCREGGLDINRIIGDMVAKYQSNHEIRLRSCIGYTTLPRGNSPGTRCSHDFAARVQITYKDITQPASLEK